MNLIFKMTSVFAVLVIVGCTNSSSEKAAQFSAEPTGKQYLATTEPTESTPVGEAREQAKDGDEVVLIGHIGGSKEPFVAGIAAFTIVDPKVAYCPPEEGCPTPWDYCCTQNEVKKNIATVKVVDEQWQPIAEDARGLLGVKELSLVIVEGIAKRDDQGNLSVLARKVFIKS